MPLDPQQLLLSLHQGASCQWNQLTSHAFSESGPLKVLNSQISNFLSSLGQHTAVWFMPRRERKSKDKVVIEGAFVSKAEEAAKRAVSYDMLVLDGASSIQPHQLVSNKGLLSAGPISKEELGRATWIFLHTLAAQFPERPTKQQQRDVKDLMAILSRLYPCKECADHFKEVLKVNPVQASSGRELAQWMCKIHNIVNRSLGKPSFPCQRVDARWGAMDCDEGACDLQGRSR